MTTPSTTLRRILGHLTMLLLLLLPALVTANSKMNIHMPTSLSKKDGYVHRLGHFGHSAMALASLAGHEQYGSMAMEVYQAPTDLCHHISDNSNLTTTWPAPFLLLTSRGNCTFVTKTRRAQHMGAAGLLIADNTCVCSDGDDCLNPNYTEHCQEEAPVVADDGSGGDVTIPALLVRKQDGQAIRSRLQTQTVMVSLSWEPPTPNASAAFQKVYYGMVLDLMDPHTAAFTESIQHVSLAVGKEAQFYPTYMIYNGTRHCTRDDCAATCTNGGRYCYPHAKGIQVVTEILRRLCIWQHHGDTSGDKQTGLEGEAFWNYVLYFDQHCAPTYWNLDADDKKNQECVDKAFKRAKVQSDDIVTCLVDTGDPKADVPNSLLEEHLQGLRNYGVITAPSIWVDNTTLPNYWAPPTPTNLLKALCANFQTKGAPQACQKCLNNPKKLNDKDVQKCALNYYQDNYKHPHRHIWRTLFLFVLILAAGAMGYVLYRRRQDGMDLTSDGLFNPLQAYMPLNGGQGGGEGEEANGMVPEQTISFQ